MKQPKFRGYSVEEDRWYYGYGWFEIDYTDEYLKEKGINQRAFLLTDSSAVECDLSSMGQFIGELDKNGVEIYEGDLLEITNGASDSYKRFLAQVHRHESSFDLTKPVYVNTIIAQPVPHFIRNTGFVRGNAYEHKNLIDTWEEQIEFENAERI